MLYTNTNGTDITFQIDLTSIKNFSGQATLVLKDEGQLEGTSNLPIKYENEFSLNFIPQDSSAASKVITIVSSKIYEHTVNICFFGENEINPIGTQSLCDIPKFKIVTEEGEYKPEGKENNFTVQRRTLSNGNCCTNEFKFINNVVYLKSKLDIRILFLNHDFEEVTYHKTEIYMENNPTSLIGSELANGLPITIMTIEEYVVIAAVCVPVVLWYVEKIFNFMA